MKDVIIGPKKYSMRAPMGKVSEQIAQKIDVANEGKLEKQCIEFNIRIQEENYFQVAWYSRASAFNGDCIYKRYNQFDVLSYKIMQFFRKIKGI